MASEELLLLKHSGDPASVAAYEAGGGFQALRQISRLSPGEIIRKLEKCKLVGRGGAAFPTAKKWDMVAQAAGAEKYVVCNADEGEPGTFKDRVLLERTPLAVIEGMVLAGYAVGARKGYLFLRGEYRDMAVLLETAIEAAKAAGYLGLRIMGVIGFDFDITVTVSAGAYICGEETALLNAIEGGRGEPRLRPPYPVTSGLYGKPTLINNTETFAQAAAALRMEPEEYLALGDEISGGAKLIALSGMVRNPGVYEIPLGRISLKTLIEAPEYGGGLYTELPVQFFQLGGQSGPVGFPEQIYTPYGYQTLQSVGLTVGSGSIAVYDTSVSPVDYVRKVMEFFAHESCGKCIPCRLGTARAEKMLTELCAGRGDMAELVSLVADIERSAACGLGQSVGRALKSFLKFRREAFFPCAAGQ